MRVASRLRVAGQPLRRGSDPAINMRGRAHAPTCGHVEPCAAPNSSARLCVAVAQRWQARDSTASCHGTDSIEPPLSGGSSGSLMREPPLSGGSSRTLMREPPLSGGSSGTLMREPPPSRGSRRALWEGCSSTHAFVRPSCLIPPPIIGIRARSPSPVGRHPARRA